MFEPLMQPNGALSGSLGLVLGVGSGRGIALLFIVLGLCHSALAGLIALYRPLYRVEQLLPDALRQATPSPDAPAIDPIPATPLFPDYLDLERLERQYANSHSPDSDSPNSHYSDSHSSNLQPSDQDIMMELPASLQPLPAAYPGDRPALAAPKDPVITLQNLNHHFGKGELTKQILFDINLSIYPGEIVIMTGPSGSGKTTLLTLIGALRSVKAGSAQILGHELNNATNRQLVQVRRNIGYIFQGHNLLPFMTARQNVRMSLALQAHSDCSQALKKVDAVLNSVDLGDYLNAYPAKLSGGQKQRVAIARALVNQPALILADEPTASLDSKTGRDVVELMYKLAKEQHCTILLVTHDNRILDIADRIIHLEDGKLQGSPQQTQPVALRPTAAPERQPDRSAAIHAVPGDTAIAPQSISQTATLESQAAPSSAAKIYTIACIADSLTTLNTLKAFLYDDIFSVVLIQDPIQALTEIIKVNPDLVIMDLAMPKLDGYQLCTLLRQRKNLQDIPVIVMTDSPKKLDAAQAKSAGITDSLAKPFDQANLIVKLFPHLS